MIIFKVKGCEGLVNDQRYRVANKCKYDIGVTLSNGQNVVISTGSFQLLNADDIVYIESICSNQKFFAKRMLVVTDQSGKEIPLDQLGAYFEEDEHPHLSDEEIQALLKGTVKKIEATIAEIDDPAELHAIAEVAKTMDLSKTKLKVLQDKMPEVDFLSDN